MRATLLTLLLLLPATVGISDEKPPLRDDAENANQERDRLFARVVELTDQVNQLQTKIARLEEERQQRLAQQAFERMRQQPPAFDGSHDLWLIDPLDAVVTAVSGKLIELSAGSDDGVTTEMQVALHRENRYLGSATIRKVTANRSVAELNSGVKVTVRKGDRVTWPENWPGVDDGISEKSHRKLNKRAQEWDKLRTAIEREY